MSKACKLFVSKMQRLVSANFPAFSALEARLRKHLQTHDGKSDLLFINSRGRRYSANKVRANALHRLLEKRAYHLADSTLLARIEQYAVN